MKFYIKEKKKKKGIKKFYYFYKTPIRTRFIHFHPISRIKKEKKNKETMVNFFYEN